MINRAPKKIYFTSIEDGTHYYTERIPFEREYIEYVRKDAFIEKVCEWLENNLQGIVGGSIYIEDFRKYMKGE